MILASGLWQSTPLTFVCLLLPQASKSVKAFPTLQHPLFCLGINSPSCGASGNAPTKIVAEVSCMVGTLVPQPNVCEKFKVADTHLGEL